jgi:hypothetical protein
MNGAALLAGIRDGNYHVGGIRCLRLFQLNDAYFASVRADVERLCRDERPSDVNDPEHITNWTKPRGEVLQFSLLNRTGRYNDFTADHDLSCLGKAFHGAAAYPALAQFVAMFTHTVNFRINILAPGARLSPHEEHAVIRTRSGSIGARVRFHLPIVTNPKAELMLDGWIYRMEPGTIYFFNHGCVHSACNGGADRRIHLVWDMLLTAEAFDCMFRGGANPLPPLERIEEREQIPLPLRTERTGAHMQIQPPVTRDEADGLSWCEVQ